MYTAPLSFTFEESCLGEPIIAVLPSDDKATDVPK